MRHKFRAWDRVNKKWLDRFYISQNGDVYDVASGGWRRLENVDLMQCRKDKNGKEIYEVIT